ncbi:MAG: hypothetical protein KME50_21390 [Nostoc desertorum CM1-VF14]|jgi:hypothetical protein|nr:hypothetical protein [Nostoc desertorum CM1-VF14]
MKNLIDFAVQKKIILAMLGMGVAILGFQVWKYQDEQYQKLLANQKVLCEKSLKDADNLIFQSKALYSAFNSGNVSNAIPKEKIQQPGINTQLQKKSYVLIRTKKRALIPNNTPHYKSIYFESYSKPPGGETNVSAIVTAEPLNDFEALVSTPCSPKPFAVSFEDLYEITQKNDFTPGGNFYWR